MASPVIQFKRVRTSADLPVLFANQDSPPIVMNYMLALIDTNNNQFVGSAL